MTGSAAPKLTENERRVLSFLACASTGQEWGAYPFRPIQRETGLDRRVVRLACRSLARKGLAAFERGLWTDDGAMAGSGYRPTSAGVDLFWNSSGMFT